MLVLTREINEVICIGDDIKIIVIGVKGTKVKLGFKAPINIPVHRQEIYYRIQKQKITNGR